MSTFSAVPYLFVGHLVYKYKICFKTNFHIKTCDFFIGLMLNWYYVSVELEKMSKAYETKLEREVYSTINKKINELKIMKVVNEPELTKL